MLSRLISRTNTTGGATVTSVDVVAGAIVVVVVEVVVVDDVVDEVVVLVTTVTGVVTALAEPSEFRAVTENVYSVPDSRTVNVYDVELVTTSPSGPPDTTYSTGSPPACDGADHVTVADRYPGVTLTLRATDGAE